MKPERPVDQHTESAPARGSRLRGGAVRARWRPPAGLPAGRYPPPSARRARQYGRAPHGARVQRRRTWPRGARADTPRPRRKPAAVRRPVERSSRGCHRRP
eukprot:4144508-Prymnesium_polylepis.1